MSSSISKRLVKIKPKGQHFHSVGVDIVHTSLLLAGVLNCDECAVPYSDQDEMVVAEPCGHIKCRHCFVRALGQCFCSTRPGNMWNRMNQGYANIPFQQAQNVDNQLTFDPYNFVDDTPTKPKVGKPRKNTKKGSLESDQNPSKFELMVISPKKQKPKKESTGKASDFVDQNYSPRGKRVKKESESPSEVRSDLRRSGRVRSNSFGSNNNNRRSPRLIGQKTPMFQYPEEFAVQGPEYNEEIEQKEEISTTRSGRGRGRGRGGNRKR